VAEFSQDANKAKLCFLIPNPTLGNVTPVDLIKMGRVRKLLSFVRSALEENQK
jgi:hypothetical protein